MDSTFFYELTLHRDGANATVIAPFVTSLPLFSRGLGVQVSVLTQSEGQSPQGLYVYDGTRWRYAIPYVDVCQAIINSATLNVYYDLDQPVTVPLQTTAWRNGLPTAATETSINDGAVWAFSTLLESGDVSSVNSVTPDGSGNVSIGISNIPGLQTALDNAGQVKTVSGQVPDTNGNIVVQATNANAATGTSLIVGSGATTANITLKTIVAGSGITLASDPNGNLQISGANQYVLPAATVSTLGGVIVGSGLSITAGGTLSVTAAGGAVSSVSGQTGVVVVEAVDNNDVSGTTLISDSGATTGVIKLKTIVAGSGITLSTDPNGNLEIMSATGSYAPINSPTFTGTPTAPTPTAGDNSTNIATTAFVENAIAAGAANAVTVYEAVSTAGQTSIPVSFSESALVEFFINGILQQSNTYSTNNVGPITVAALVAGQDIKVVITQPLAVAGTVPTSGGAFTGPVQGITPTPGDNSTNFATTAFVDGAIAAAGGVTSFNTRTGAVTLTTADITTAGGAPIASPALTGTPTAPTATAGTNTTQLATTAFVTAAVTASGGVASFNTRTGAVTLQLADVTGVGGAPLASPALTGTPTAPTATAGTNTTQVATTAFVQAAVSSSGVTTFNTRAGAVTLQASDVTGVGGALLASPAFTGTPTTPTATAGTNTTQVASTAYVVTALGTYAPLASPTFTGVPAAPTATAGTNTTQLATTAFVQAAVTASGGVASFNTRTGAVTLQAADVTGVGGALLASPTFTGTPAAPTATAGTNTTQIATTAYVVTALGTYAPLASPALTGTPTAPTAAIGTNTTQVATTGYVYSATQGSVSVPLTNANVTLSAAQYGAPVIVFTGTLSASVTITVPTTGEWDFVNLTTGAFTVTVSNGTGATQAVAQSTTSFTPLVSNAVQGVLPVASSGGVASFNTRTGAVTLQAADVTGVGGALLASPTFTGTPAAPTATAGTSTTQIATTAFVATSFAPIASPSLTGRTQSPAYSYSVIALGSISGTQTLNLAAASEWTMTIAGATTIAFTNTLAANTEQTVFIRFTNAGSATITWPSGTQFAGGTAPTFTASGVDLVGVKYDSTSSVYQVFVIGLNVH